MSRASIATQPSAPTTSDEATTTTTTTDIPTQGFPTAVTDTGIPGPAAPSSGDTTGSAASGSTAAAGTTPAAGTKVDPADPTVILTLSDAVVVPDVTQGDVGVARQQLSDLGLQVAVSAMFGSSGASVMSQNPGGGTRVEPGSTVLVTAFP